MRRRRLRRRARTALVGAVGDPASGATLVCATSGPVRGLSSAQAANARILVAAAESRGGDRAAQIALMVALAESNLLVLANPHDPSGSAYPSQGVGYDHDSLGLFQQRPGWGSAAKRMDPTASTNLFLDALLGLPHWSTLSPSYAAQLVQRSAYTGSPSAANHYSSTVGGNYLARQAEAVGRLLGLIQLAGEATDCGGSTAGLSLPASARSHGLPAGYAVPSSASPAAVVAVTFALAQLGKPYQWGATGPGSYDCSGLVQAAWRRAGVTISRVTRDQAHDGTATDVAHLRPGDLVLTPGSDGSLAAPGHVGMYIGDGLVVEAPPHRRRRQGRHVRLVHIRRSFCPAQLRVRDEIAFERPEQAGVHQGLGENVHWAGDGPTVGGNPRWFPEARPQEKSLPGGN